MTPIQLAEKLKLKIVSKGDGTSENISGVFCCDLLSIATSKAKAGAAWVTVISNVNTIAVAVLAKVSCVIIPEGIPVNEEVRQKAEEHGVCLLQSELPAFETALGVHELLR